MNAGALALSGVEATQAAIGERVGVKQSVVCRWMHGETKPSARARQRLFDEYGIPWTAWEESSPVAPVKRSRGPRKKAA